MSDELIFASVETLLAVISDAAVCGQRLRSLQEKAGTAKEAMIDAQLAQNVLDEKAATLAQREAAVEERERALKVREFTFDQKAEEATGQLRASYEALVAADTAMKLRLLNYAGWLEGFDPGIRSLPDWPAIERMLGGAVDVIPEMRDTPTDLTREGWGGDKFSEQSTLTRSVPMSEHDDQPMPNNIRRDPSRKARRHSRRAAL